MWTSANAYLLGKKFKNIVTSKQNLIMRNKLLDTLYQLKISRTVDEKIELMNSELAELINHFHGKAGKSKQYFQMYKYCGILLAALTTIVSSLQVIYPSSFPPWILPITSAGATVAVALLGASSAQKIWINSRTTQQRLQTEQFLFNQNAGRYAGLSVENRIQLFSERLVTLWDEGHGRWEQNVGDD